MAAVSGGGGRGENLFCCICLVEIGKVGRGLPYFQFSLLCFSSALLIASPDCDLSRSHRCGKGSAETAATIPATFTDWPRRAYRVTPWRLAVASSSTFAMGDGHSGSWWDRQAVGGPLLAGAPHCRREGGHRALVSPSVRRQGWRLLPATGFFCAAAASISACRGQRTRITVTFSRTCVVGGGRSIGGLASPLAGGGRMVAGRAATWPRGGRRPPVTWSFRPARQTLPHKVERRGRGPPTLCGSRRMRRRT